MTGSSAPKHLLAGKVAVVTGGSSGVGLAISKRLATNGITVALVARGRANLEATAEEIRRQGGTVATFQCDVAIAEDVLRLHRQVLEEVDAPQILINCAGTFSPLALLVESVPNDWVQTININLIGTYLTCRAFVPAMVSAGWGRVINMSSSSSVVAPMPMTSAYAASKAGVNLLTRALARELNGTGVTANVLHPGDVDTAMTQKAARTVEELGAAGEGLRKWSKWLKETGGDSPDKAADLVLEALAGDDTGRFLWIPDSLWGDLPTW